MNHWERCKFIRVDSFLHITRCVYSGKTVYMVNNNIVDFCDTWFKIVHISQDNVC